MSVRIRLTRTGSKKHPTYRIVVATSTSPRDGKFIEWIGNYNPLLPRENEARFVIKTDRVEYWLSQGAAPSEVVARQLTKIGVKIPESLFPRSLKSVESKPKKPAKKEKK